MDERWAKRCVGVSNDSSISAWTRWAASARSGSVALLSYTVDLKDARGSSVTASATPRRRGSTRSWSGPTYRDPRPVTRPSPDTGRDSCPRSVAWSQA